MWMHQENIYAREVQDHDELDQLHPASRSSHYIPMQTTHSCQGLHTTLLGNCTQAEQSNF